MRGLQPPPSQEAPSRIAARLIVLVVLLFLFAVVIWAAVTNQQIPLVEDRPLDTVDLADSEVSDGLRYNVADRGDSPTPVFLFHDVEITGSVMFESLVAALGDDVRTVAVDLPGFGLTSRITSPGNVYTVTDMAERLVPVIEARSAGPVVLAGTGLGGKVAAEIAVTRPDLVSGLVMIDVDFYGGGSFVNTLERIPFIGTAVTYAWEVSGPMSGSAQAPYCDQGGWCPSDSQLASREFIDDIAGTTYSLHGFRNTTPAANVPSLLVDITAPTIYVWSERGPVPQDSVDRVLDAMPSAVLHMFDVFQAVHEESEQVADLIVGLTG